MARKISVEIVGDSRNLERAFGRASKAGSTFGSKMRTLGKVAATGVAGGFFAFGLALRAGFKELAQAQVVAAQTRAVLMSTRGAANVTAKGVDRLATSISRMSGIDDEAVASAENLLLTFTLIRNQAGKGNDVFDQTTKATVDMATAMGMDLNSAALLVGKAMNQMDVTTQGNVRGFMALRRIGVQITPQMMAQAKAFIEAGNAMGAQKLLLQELNTEFGGSAAAFGTTMPGALGKLRNAFDELMAAFATGFLPIVLRVANALTTKLANPAFVARVRQLGFLVGTTLLNAFAAVGAWFVAHWPQIQTGFRVTGTILTNLAAGVTVLKEAFMKMARVVGQMIRIGIIVPMALALQVISGMIDALSRLPFIGGKFKGAKEFVNSARETLAGVDKGLANIGRQGGAGKPKAPVRASGPAGTSAERKGGRGGIPAGGDVVVQVNGREIARAALPQHQRVARTGSASRRGPRAGTNLGIG